VKPPLQIAFLTGASDPRSAALSPEQTAFLDALPAPDSWKVRMNFPYPRTTSPYRDIPLLFASWRNGCGYLASRRRAFAERYRPRVLECLGAAERTLLLADSSGIELLANLRLPAAALDRLHVFAYGPVARGLPGCDGRLVQGRRDLISRACFSTVDAQVEGGHLDYLGNPAVLALCRAYLQEIG
jgi:hypothetical protein